MASIPEVPPNRNLMELGILAGSDILISDMSEGGNGEIIIQKADILRTVSVLINVLYLVT